MILFLNDLVAAVVTATVGIDVHDLGAGDQDIPAFHGGAVVGDVGFLFHLGQLVVGGQGGILLGAVGVLEAAAVLVTLAAAGEDAGKQIAGAEIETRAGALNASAFIRGPVVRLLIGVIVGAVVAGAVAGSRRRGTSYVKFGRIALRIGQNRQIQRLANAILTSYGVTVLLQTLNAELIGAGLFLSPIGTVTGSPCAVVPSAILVGAGVGRSGHITVCLEVCYLAVNPVFRRAIYSVRHDNAVIVFSSGAACFQFSQCGFGCSFSCIIVAILIISHSADDLIEVLTSQRTVIDRIGQLIFLVIGGAVPVITLFRLGNSACEISGRCTGGGVISFLCRAKRTRSAVLVVISIAIVVVVRVLAQVNITGDLLFGAIGEGKAVLSIVQQNTIDFFTRLRILNGHIGIQTEGIKCSCAILRNFAVVGSVSIGCTIVFITGSCPIRVTTLAIGIGVVFAIGILLLDVQQIPDLLRRQAVVVDLVGSVALNDRCCEHLHIGNVLNLCFIAFTEGIAAAGLFDGCNFAVFSCYLQGLTNGKSVELALKLIADIINNSLLIFLRLCYDGRKRFHRLDQNRLVLRRAETDRMLLAVRTGIGGGISCNGNVATRRDIRILLTEELLNSGRGKISALCHSDRDILAVMSSRISAVSLFLETGVSSGSGSVALNGDGVGVGVFVLSDRTSAIVINIKRRNRAGGRGSRCPRHRGDVSAEVGKSPAVGHIGKIFILRLCRFGAHGLIVKGIGGVTKGITGQALCAIR